MKLDVPYLSQHQDVQDSTWHNKSCGIVCVKMILDFLRSDIDEKYMSVDDVITEGITIGGYKQNIGWDHEALVRLFRNRGINAYRQEFVTKRNEYSEKLLKDGLEKIVASLQDEQVPIIASVTEGFDENEFSHLIVITGCEVDENHELQGLYCHDPDARIGKKSHVYVSKETFVTYWRKFLIFVEK